MSTLRRSDGSARSTGVGSLAQVLRDLDELAALGAEHVVLDTYTGRPVDRWPAAEDWRTLDTVAARWHARQ
jgi:hypothetical protein